MLVWTDLETSGLKAGRHKLLEVASIITDDKLNEVARFQRVIYFNRAARIVELAARGLTSDEIAVQIGGLTQQVVNAFVIDMHLKNGLWKECVYGQALDTVYRDFKEFIDDHGCQTVDPKDPLKLTVQPQLAGSTVSFDRGFLAEFMPDVVEKSLHYRNVDVSTFNETAKRWWPELFLARPGTDSDDAKKAHRGMADIEESIAVYKYYLGNVGPK